MPDPYIVTYSGRIVYLQHPDPADILIEDIAHALSHICRYTGHVREFYSVAQHSCYVSDYCPSYYKMWGLLHDASEAYLGDVSAPLKSLLPEYRVLEEVWMGILAIKFDLPWEVGRHTPLNVSYYDACALHNEVARLFPIDIPDSTWRAEGKALEGLTIEPWSPDIAEWEFLYRYKSLIMPL